MTTVVESGSPSRGALPLHRSSSAWRQPDGSLGGVSRWVVTVAAGAAARSGATAGGWGAAAAAATGGAAGRIAGADEAQAPVTMAARTAHREGIIDPPRSSAV
jgi:hypothetical protein